MVESNLDDTVVDGIVIDDTVVDDTVVDDTVVDDTVVDDTVVDDTVVDDTVVDDTADWMKEDDDQTLSDSMPVSAHIRAKRKLKGKIEDRDAEIEKLKKENEGLKKQGSATPIRDKILVRPKQDEFESFEAYQTALDEYEDKRLDSKISVIHGQNQLRDTQAKAIKKLNSAVDDHYLRADKLIKDSGISAETYKQADEIVRSAIEAIRPGQGNIVVDQIISLLGKGSEKVIYKLGRSNALRGELITLLSEDPHGLRATAFLGEQKAKLLSTTKRRSTAPAPANELNGDASSSNKERVFKKKYDNAHSKGNSQAAYNAKKEAKAAGINTSKW